MNSFGSKRSRQSGLINRLSGARADQPFHSSGYAQEARGNLIGATSPETFERRRDVERQRKLVRRYRDSKIGRLQNDIRPQFRPDFPKKTDTPAAQQSPSLADTTQQRQSFNSTNSSPPAKPTFQEPPRRGYNPYQ